jgi:hypothetical protein
VRIHPDRPSYQDIRTRTGPLRDVEPVRDVEKEKAPENSPGAFSIAYS